MCFIKCYYKMSLNRVYIVRRPGTIYFTKGYDRAGQTTFLFTLFRPHLILLHEQVYCTFVHSRTDNCSSDFQYQTSESELGHFLDSYKACASHSHVFPSAFSPLLKHKRKLGVWYFLYCYTLPSPREMPKKHTCNN
jgi:hypothetical protein